MYTPLRPRTRDAVPKHERIRIASEAKFSAIEKPMQLYEVILKREAREQLLGIRVIENGDRWRVQGLNWGDLAARHNAGQEQSLRPTGRINIGDALVSIDQLSLRKGQNVEMLLEQFRLGIFY